MRRRIRRTITGEQSSVDNARSQLWLGIERLCVDGKGRLQTEARRYTALHLYVFAFTSKWGVFKGLTTTTLMKRHMAGFKPTGDRERGPLVEGQTRRCGGVSVAFTARLEKRRFRTRPRITAPRNPFHVPIQGHGRSHGKGLAMLLKTPQGHGGDDRDFFNAPAAAAARNSPRGEPTIHTPRGGRGQWRSESRMWEDGGHREFSGEENAGASGRGPNGHRKTHDA